jgi:hypothetical protein
VVSYEYHGPRGRRDPWVDPRIPVEDDSPSRYTVPEQAQIVEELVARTREVVDLWGQAKAAPNVVVEMTLKSELEMKLASLEAQAQRTVDEGQVTFVPSERRLQLEVIEPMSALRAEIVASRGGEGPSLSALTELLATMKRHVGEGAPEMALAAFRTVETELDHAERDQKRRPLVVALRRAAEEARILTDFQKLEIEVTGIAIAEGAPPVALINGRALGEGDLVNDELVIRAIKAGEIEFIFRGVVLVRRF